MTVGNPLIPLEIQLWQAALEVGEAQVGVFETLLAEDELKRAERLIFPIHKRRFIVARGILRTLLGQYLNCNPRDLRFLYTEYGKPYLADTDLRFNISHSEEMAVYAFTREAEVGVDIEKIEKIFKQNVARRFFSNAEYEILTALSGMDQERGFYRMWARKEALIKGFGEGLRIPLDSFSVTLADQEQLEFPKQGTWYLQSFTVAPDYEAAFAVSSPPKKVTQSTFIC